MPKRVMVSSKEPTPLCSFCPLNLALELHELLSPLVHGG